MHCDEQKENINCRKFDQLINSNAASFRVLSYNILADSLIDRDDYSKKHFFEYLDWKIRGPKLLEYYILIII
jgi:mRNA deadenylase 3'-5' endonuclease subunit Ccr4